MADIVLDLGQGGSVTLHKALSGNGPAPGKIERVAFDDGTVWRNKSRRWWDGGNAYLSSRNSANGKWRVAA